MHKGGHNREERSAEPASTGVPAAIRQAFVDAQLALDYSKQDTVAEYIRAGKALQDAMRAKRIGGIRNG